MNLYKDVKHRWYDFSLTIDDIGAYRHTWNGFTASLVLCPISSSLVAWFGLQRLHFVG